MVANEASLLEGAGRLKPAVVVVDLSLSAGDLQRPARAASARARPARRCCCCRCTTNRTVAEAALAAGADAVVLKRCLATDLMPAVDAVLAGQTLSLTRDVTPGMISEAHT